MTNVLSMSAQHDVDETPTTPCMESPELFFANDRYPEDIKAAKKMCGTCDVRLACLQLALDNREQHGIWGGFTEVERARMTPTTPTTRVCALAECNAHVPVGRRLFCSTSHGNRANNRAYEARRAAS